MQAFGDRPAGFPIGVGGDFITPAQGRNRPVWSLGPTPELESHTGLVRSTGHRRPWRSAHWPEASLPKPEQPSPTPVQPQKRS